MKIFVINGANLNLMGKCQTGKFGTTTLEDVEKQVKELAGAKGIETVFCRSNFEGELIEFVQRAYFEKADGIIINPGGYRHSSLALREALEAVGLPAIEVHITSIGSKEFHHDTLLAGVSLAQVCGQVENVYQRAFDSLVSHF